MLIILHKTMNEAPSILTLGSQMFLELEGQEIRLSSELKEEIENLLSELKNC